MVHKYTAEAAWAPFANIIKLPIMPFHDATFCKQDYKLTVFHCLQGLSKAMDAGWYHPDTFDQEEYELFDNPSNADMHFLSPQFVAFKGPSHRRTKLMPGVYTFTPRHYAAIFKERGVKTVVRLNEATTYDKEEFEKAGIHHIDLYFDDCTVPSNAIVLKFLNAVEARVKHGAIAVHCKAGLGRTGTLIAIFWMKHFGFTAAQCIGWQRIVRPGSIIGPQQKYLHWAEDQLTSMGKKVTAGGAEEPEQSISAEQSAQMGLDVAAAQNTRSSHRLGDA